VTIAEKEGLILRGLAAGDAASIESIYRDNYNVIQAFILANNGSADDARDIFQESMVVLYEKSLDPSFSLNCQIRTYVYSVCRRLWLKRLQQLKRFRPQADGLEEIVPVEEALEEHEQRNQDFNLMEQAVSRMGEPCRSLLNAYYVQRKSMQEIAADFGYTNAENAKTQKYKCLVRLRKIFFSLHKSE
jgi:RNA polymerase sigma factor (sigma-70 family)